MVALALRVWGAADSYFVVRVPNRDRVVVVGSNLCPLLCESESSGSLGWIYATLASSYGSHVDRKKRWLSAVRRRHVAPVWPNSGSPSARIWSGRRQLRRSRLPNHHWRRAMSAFYSPRMRNPTLLADSAFEAITVTGRTNTPLLTMFGDLSSLSAGCLKGRLEKA
jgi:hypothetical protein